jgi:hypothetical protein
MIAFTDQVRRVGGRQPWREVLLRLTRGRWGRLPGWHDVPPVDMPWEDTVSSERPGWRTRAATLHGFPAIGREREECPFAVDYQICRRCRLGWVEQPYTPPPYQRRGLAAAGLAALRAEHPGLSWHTLGGHIDGSPAFWTRAGAGVPGGYQPRGVCGHVTAGG